MPSFKPKTIKKIKFNKKNAITLDNKHKEFMTEFAKDENNRIPELLNEKNKIKEQLKSPEITLNIELKLELTDKLKEINSKIKDLKNKKKEYFLDNSKYIFEYFENKKNISNEESNFTNIKNTSNTTTTTSKNKILNNFFKIQQPANTDKKQEISNNNIVQKYLSNIDDIFLDINSYVYPTDICNFCYKGELIPLEDEGVLMCNTCYRYVPYLIENEKPSYKEPPKEVCFYAYKRINHFKEILAQFQGKETTQIPHDVIDNIKLQIKKERIELSEITNIKTKEILKKLGYNKYYEHIPFIKDKLGIKPPIMSSELEETLCNLFIELQSPYSKFCPDDRVNFLNYYYTAYKLCELLGENQYLSHFPMLKDKEKRVEQDNIWKKICGELNWEFIPTI
uniref:Viral late gene transcription factor 3 zinc ribbon domain-containing protein n=1 Tax=viral metagenome TaxID=1070528 RepID=A0A6C0JHC4_9ZZZZ